ncbi:MAG: flagellar hook-length control protein FliK [Xanthobacteraceae bacterium]|uniref:flagellar hook-length control protein FliK n=1 Tax=Pseudolabrys sp. TaxID=1960880 RepID=UPI003D13D336
MPQVASEAHATSHASARSGQRNRPANAHADAPAAPFASLIDRASAGDGDIAARPDQPAEAVKQPEASRAERSHQDRRGAGRAANRDDKPVHRSDKADRADNDAEPAETKDTKTDAKAADESNATEGDEDTTVIAGDDSKETTDGADPDADAVLADGVQVAADPSQADAAKPADIKVAAAPVVTAQVTAEASETPAEADPVIGGDKPATPALFTADLKAAAGETAKTDGKSDAAKPADTADVPDDKTFHDALKAQHDGNTHDAKPADAANAKPADGDANAAAEQKTHHAGGADKATEVPGNANSNTAQTQGPQNQPQGPQGPNAVQHTQPATAQANVAAAPQAPAVPVEGVAVQLTAQAKAGKHSFEIRLDPPELGRIDVRLDVDRHGHVTSRLVVDRPETLDLLRRDANGLERALQDAGLKTSDNGMQFSLRDQSMQQQAFRQSRDTAEVIVRDDALPPVETMQRGYRTLAGSRGGVDIRV